MSAPMSLDSIVGLLVSFGLLVYLVVAMMKPEKF
jgi:K+-transporting ATPase KdpF subunit